jgi:hypothetical protein
MIRPVSKKLVLGVVSMLSIGLSSQVALGQRISVSDFEFGPETVQAASIILKPGSTKSGEWDQPTIEVSCAANLTSHEALLSVYEVDGTDPVLTKLMTRIPGYYYPEEPPIVIMNANQPKGSASISPSIWPPQHPSKQFFSADLMDGDVALPPGSYIAQVDFYYLTDGFPEGPEWSAWTYPITGYATKRPSGLWSKHVGSSSIEFNIKSEEIDLAKFVSTQSTIKARVVPNLRISSTARNRLNAFARTQVQNYFRTTKAGLEGLSSFKINPEDNWVVTDGGGDRSGMSKIVNHYGSIHTDKVPAFQKAVGAGTQYNQTNRLQTADGLVIMTVETTVSAQ